MATLDLKTLNSKLDQQQKFMNSQGFFYADAKKNGEFRLLNFILPHMDCFIDVGCNKGTISEYSRKVNPNLNFHLFDILDETELEFYGTNFTYNRNIVSDEIGEENIYTIPPNDNWDTSEVSSVFLREDYNCSDEDFVKKQFLSVTLDNYSNSFSRKSSYFLKMDIEGSEMKALHGATKFLKDFDVCGYLEYHPEAWKNGGFQYKNLYRYMLSIGLELYRITPLGLKEIAYYAELNEPLFCYYFFCKKGGLNKYKLETSDIKRKASENYSKIHLF